MAPAAPVAIEARRLTKYYESRPVVRELDWALPVGAACALLGPNGAGKTTTIGCISGLLKPTSGHVAVSGHDVVKDARAAKRQLGIVPQELALYEDLPAAGNLEFWGGAYGLAGATLRQRVAEVLTLTGLADRAKDKTSTFSGGMKRRLNFGCGIVHNPRVLLLDEPTAGVDPQSRVRLLDLVRDQARAGTTIIYTTHYMEEAQELCDRIAIMDHGKLLAMGTLEELRRLLGEKDLVRLAGRFDAPAAARALGTVEGVDVLSVAADAVTISAAGASRKLPAIFGALASAGADIQETTLSVPSLESLFITLTGRELRE